MNEKNFTVSLAQMGAIALIIINLLVVGPGGWLLNTLWNEEKDFKTSTEEQFEDLKQELSELKVEVSSKYVTRQTFSDYREQMTESIIYIDSKIDRKLP